MQIFFQAIEITAPPHPNPIFYYVNFIEKMYNVTGQQTHSFAFYENVHNKTKTLCQFLKISSIFFFFYINLYFYIQFHYCTFLKLLRFVNNASGNIIRTRIPFKMQKKGKFKCSVTLTPHSLSLFLSFLVTCNFMIKHFKEGFGWA